MQTYTERRK